MASGLEPVHANAEFVGHKEISSGSIWVSADSVKRKRSEDGKDSDVTISGRNYTRQEINKEIARHVPLGRKLYSSEDPVLPDYITLSSRLAEGAGLTREFLLRDPLGTDLIDEFQAGSINANTTLNNVAETGKTLCKSRLVRKLSFAGSVRIEKLLAKQCAQNLTQLSFELGGNRPFMVFDDAKIETAVEASNLIKFRNLIESIKMFTVGDGTKTDTLRPNAR
ncbi:hypothetical protein BDV06DRAFT_229529 [Aspergillus oleicola]